jgi:hypothetical protein
MLSDDHWSPLHSHYTSFSQKKLWYLSLLKLYTILAVILD